MTGHVKDGAVWKTANSIYVKDGTVWKEVEEGYVKDGTIWKLFYSKTPPPTVIATRVFTSNGTFTLPLGTVGVKVTGKGSNGTSATSGYYRADYPMNQATTNVVSLSDQGLAQLYADPRYRSMWSAPVATGSLADLAPMVFLVYAPYKGAAEFWTVTITTYYRQGSPIYIPGAPASDGIASTVVLNGVTETFPGGTATSINAPTTTVNLTNFNDGDIITVTVPPGGRVTIEYTTLEFP